MLRYALVIAVIAVQGSSYATAATSGSVYTQNRLDGLKRKNSATGFSQQQIRNDVYRKAVPQYSFSTQNRNLFSSALNGPAQKPFSNLGARGGVSPYLGLSAPYSSTAEQYYTQVRPQIQQQRINQQMQQRNAQLQHQLNSIAAQPPYDPQGSETVAPTGHVAVFQNYGGYYPESAKKR